MAGGGGASLRELSSLLAGNAELAAEKLGVILCQCPPSGSLHDGSTRLHPRQLSAILAVAQFLSQSSSSAEEIQMDLWHVILEFLRTIPYYGQDDIWSSAFSSLWATAFFKDFMLAVVKFTKSRAVLAAELSTIIADIIQKITALSNREVSAPIAPGVKFFLVALSENCPHLSADDVERVIKALLEQWAVNFQPGNTQPSSSDTSYHSSPSMSKKSHQHTPQSNGTSSPYKDSQSTPPQYNSINVHGLVSRYEHQLDPSPTTSTSTILTNAFTPSKLVEDHVTSRSGQLNGSGRGGLDYFYNAQPEVQGERGSSMRLQGNALEGESLYVLERQEIAFRLVSHILEKADGDRVVSDLVQLRNSAVLQLKGVLPLLKGRRQDWPADGEDLKIKLELKIRASHGATVLKTRCILLSESDEKTKGSLRESFPLLLDAADVCLASPWRKLRSCEELFDALLSGVAQVAIVLGNQIQRSVLLRLKSVILGTCAQAETWGTGQSFVYESMLKSSCLLLETAWNSDKSSVESFLLSLAAHIRERVEHGEKERHVIYIQTNLISFLADLATRFSKREMGEIILPQFVESLEQADTSVPGLLRLKLIEALARIGSSGCEKSYREVVILLTRSYLDKVTSVDATYTRAQPTEGTTEHLDTLAGALLQLARGLQQPPKLRADLRERLLNLCSNVGLAAEAKNGRIGADFLGPLLPAVAEICTDFDPTQDVEPAMLKMYRNLWFYIALFGLAPPVQKQQQLSLRQISNQAGNISSTHSSLMALQAVGGTYMWNSQWSAAATLITHGTPPLVVSSVKWLEDEHELKALHKPDSRRGAGSEKAATTQRAALSAAIGGLVDASAMSTISGVKATYLLAVAFLEILRLSHCGGVLGSSSLKGGCTTALTCAFKYLESPDLPLAVQQCLAAIVHQAFNAALSWLGERTLLTEEQAAEREAIVAAHTCFLIKAVAHREENVRDMADSLLNQIKTRFPQVLWNPQCLDEVLRLAAEFGADAGAPASSRGLWNQRVREWIAYAIVLAPCTVQGLLQEQFRKLNTWQKAAQTSDLLSLLSDVRLDSSKTDGWSGNINLPAVLAAAAAAAGASPQSSKVGSTEVLSTGIISANIKSNYAGEIAGMKKLYAGMGAMNLGTVSTNAKPQVQGEDTTLHEMLTTRFVQLLQQFVVTAERGSIVDSVAFREACLRGAALLLSDTDHIENAVSEGFDQLLRLLCWCPAHIFTPETMETGVFVWTWLLTASPKLGSRVLSELVDAWLWTVDTKKGLFASGIENSGPAAKLRPQLTTGVPGPCDDKELVQGITAHQVWLGFLLDRFEVVRNVSSDQLYLMSRLLQGSVKSPTQFSSHPAATGSFFTLILLSLKFCAFQAQVSSGVSNTGICLLEKRSYRAALGWFAVEPGWYDGNVEGVLQAEAKAMGIFVQYLMSNRPQGSANIEGSFRHTQENPFSDSVQGDSQHSWGRDEDYFDRERQRQLLLMLCQCEADRLETWANPLMKESSAPRIKVTADQWIEYVRTAWSVDPRIALSLVSRFPTVSPVKVEVTSMVQKHLLDLVHIPEALPYFVTPKAVDEDSVVLRNLLHWAPCSITRALQFLTPDYKGHHRVMAYVLRVMETYPPERVTFFMPQLVQSLRYDQKGLVEGYLMVAAQRSNLFAHILIWQLQGEERPSSEEAAFGETENTEGNLYDIVPKVRQRIIDSFTPEANDVFLREFDFFAKVTSISGVLYPLPKDERRAGIKRELEKITIPGQDLYLPTAPNKYVRGIQLDSGIPLQSAAKVPIMITFDVVDKDGDPNNLKPQACIFKVGDDCRQDVLALQVIALLRDIFTAVGINLYLFPYGVLPTGFGRGIIEVVPNTRSRNQMGEISDGGLYEIFQDDFGPVGSPKFEEARENFIVSSAGYAVASLLLQPKDRHNGNLLFDKDGRLVHIDFGFILETSPGNNMRFESAHFKLSHEMTQLLDPSGAMKSDYWYRFVSLCVKGYLTARQHMDGIINTVLLMKDSGLPCFSRGDPIGNLRKRFHPEMTEREAANYMIKTCGDAYNKWTTAGYDLIQFLQQGIEK
ncbi:phosphatidylinositol 4-kinase A [Marchantia polymorpha subsp. ruderalis]|uniref:1-phosphatidylinositol 4-kinase n=2 Tax=Marchantia polymorpha TaxID=3197 RepID=A0AAF6ASK0_MARPO|nr:hypothetical protein MARPO_0001s0451 [Marchantia polymorpha]BBM99420.1 hypothetical protein Mp_1g21170 [Marchantia polymorpha subsp. ruderalis]|eukprot:PTQ50501.1 hypothetical protein MARPO_0001s0451 [Marchantia polymorpha]